MLNQQELQQLKIRGLASLGRNSHLQLYPHLKFTPDYSYLIINPSVHSNLLAFFLPVLHLLTNSQCNNSKPKNQSSNFPSIFERLVKVVSDTRLDLTSRTVLPQVLSKTIEQLELSHRNLYLKKLLIEYLLLAHAQFTCNSFWMPNFLRSYPLGQELVIIWLRSMLSTLYGLEEALRWEESVSDATVFTLLSDALGIQVDMGSPISIGGCKITVVSTKEGRTTKIFYLCAIPTQIVQTCKPMIPNSKPFFLTGLRHERIKYERARPEKISNKKNMSQFFSQTPQKSKGK